MSYLDKLDTSRFNFPVEMTAVHIPAFTLGDKGLITDYHEVPQSMARAVVRTDINEVLGIHGKDYKLAPHSTLFNSVNNGLVESGLDLSDITVKDGIHDNGARVERRVIFNRHQIDVGEGDMVGLCLNIRNSYDGGWSFVFDFGGFRFHCFNGCVRGVSVARHRGKHTANLSTTAAIEKLKSGVYVLENMRDEFLRYRGTPVIEGQVQTLFKETLAYLPRHDKETPPFSDRALGHLMNLYESNASKLGGNQWAVYNAATEWSSHVEDTMTKRGAAHNVRVQREEKVAQMLRSNQWAGINQLKLAA